MWINQNKFHLRTTVLEVNAIKGFYRYYFWKKGWLGYYQNHAEYSGLWPEMNAKVCKQIEIAVAKP